VKRLVLSDEAESESEESENEVRPVSFWEESAFLCALFEPIYALLKLTDAAKPTIGLVYEKVNELSTHLDNLFEKEDSPWKSEPFIHRQPEILDCWGKR
jgi:hypothetical protein